METRLLKNRNGEQKEQNRNKTKRSRETFTTVILNETTDYPVYISSLEFKSHFQVLRKEKMPEIEGQSMHIRQILIFGQNKT